MGATRAERILTIGAALLGLFAGACSGDDEAARGPASPAGGGAPGGAVTARVGDPARGEQIYGNVCATCHGSNPAEAGTAGPAVAGSSLELVEAKLLRGEYPPGYTPKRGSRSMPPLPYLEEYVPDITAYLQSSPDGGPP